MCNCSSSGRLKAQANNIISKSIGINQQLAQQAAYAERSNQVLQNQVLLQSRIHQRTATPLPQRKFR